MRTLLLIIFSGSQFIFSCQNPLCSQEEVCQNDLKILNELQSAYPAYMLEVDSCMVSELKLDTETIDTMELKKLVKKLTQQNGVFKKVLVYSNGDYQFKLYPIYEDFSQTKIKDIGILPINHE